MTSIIKCECGNILKTASNEVITTTEDGVFVYFTCLICYQVYREKAKEIIDLEKYGKPTRATK